MREIKFRAWVNGKMLTFDHESCDYYLELDKFATAELIHIEERGTWDHYMDKEYQKEAVLMQYTGLKDCNGKEIYEGDIVKGVGEHVGQSNVFYGYGVWQPFSYLGTYQGSEFEVISNIYENPELLKHE